MIRNPKMEALIQVAKSQVGTVEEAPNDGAAIRIYQSLIGRAEKEPWCISFIQWCVAVVDRQMQSKTVLYPTESSMLLLAKTPRVARIDKPEPGALVIYQYWQLVNVRGDSDVITQAFKPTSRGHGEIITSVLDDQYMMTVGGNTSSGLGVQREGDGVYERRRSIVATTGNMRIAAFLLPWAG